MYSPATQEEVRTVVFILFAALLCLLMVTGCANGEATVWSASNGGTLPGDPGQNYSGGGGDSAGLCVNRLPGFSAQESEFIEEVCILTNQERERQGLPPLTLDVKMSEAAQAHAVDMHTRSYFSHDNPEGESPFDRMRNLGIEFGYAAENIARGYPTPQDVIDGWMKSSGHRANILHSKMKRIGVGYHRGYWVQNFAD